MIRKPIRRRILWLAIIVLLLAPLLAPVVLRNVAFIHAIRNLSSSQPISDTSVYNQLSRLPGNNEQTFYLTNLELVHQGVCPQTLDALSQSEHTLLSRAAYKQALISEKTDPSQAGALYNCALQLSARDKVMRGGYISFLQRQKDYEGMLEQYQILEQENLITFQNYISLGSLWLNNLTEHPADDRFQNAHAAYSNAAQLEAHRPEPLIGLVQIALKTEDFNLALELARDLALNQPDCISCRRTLAQVYQARREYPQAAQWAAAAIALNEKSYADHSLYAAILASLNTHPKLIERELKAAYLLRPSSANYAINLGDFYAKHGHPDWAADYYRRARSLNPAQNVLDLIEKRLEALQP